MNKQIHCFVCDPKNETCADEEDLSFMKYDVEEASGKIRIWKGHIMNVINQEQHKRDILDNLDDQTCLIIIDIVL